MTMTTPIFNVPIQNIHPSDEIPPTLFTALEWKIQSTALKILIEHQCPKNPNFQGLLDDTNNRFYLVGGILDDPLETTSNKMVRCAFTQTHQAWLSIDLFKMEKKGELNIFTMGYPVYTCDGKKCNDGEATLLMKVNL